MRWMDEMSIYNAIREETIVAYIIDDIIVIFMPLKESAPSYLSKIGPIDVILS